MDKLVEKLVFGRSRLNSSVFEKILISYSCISFMKYYALRSFLHKIALFFKNLFFPEFWSIEPVFQSIEIAINFWFEYAWLDWCSINSRSIATEKFSVSMFLTKIVFFPCIICVYDSQALHCFCIHLVVLQSYHSLFSHITCIHFATLGTQPDQKIYWLIFELCTF